MAVIITNGNTSLNTALGFYRCEAYNWGAVYVSTAAHLALTTTRSFDVTFSNAGNLQGVCLCLYNSFNALAANNSTHTNRDINVWFEETKGTFTVTIASPGVVTLTSHGFAANQEVELTTTGALPTGLAIRTKYFVRNPTANTFELSATSGGASINTSGSQSGTHTCWAIRDSKTLTSSQIMNTTDNSTSGVIVPFPMTAPYAIDTSANKWRYTVSQSSGTNGWTLLASSSATPTPLYAAWCDNAVTFADNDSVIAKDVLTIDKTATLKGVLGAGNTSIAWALAGCRQTDPTVANVANIQWQNPPSASYTLTIDGTIVASSHTGLRIGTAASKISAANKAIVHFTTPTAGTTPGFTTVTGYGASSLSRFSLFIHGDYLATRDTTLSQAIKAGTVTMTIASPCVVTWTSNTLSENDAVCITTTGALPTGLTATTVYYVKGLSGNTFNLSATPGGAAINTSGTQSGTHTMNTPVMTTDTTGWTVGSIITVGGANVKASSDLYDKRTIATISGNMITLSKNIPATVPRIAGGKVVNWDEGYGVRFSHYNAASLGYMPCVSNLYIEGLENRCGLNLYLSNGIYTWNHEDATARSAQVVTRSCIHNYDYTTNRYFLQQIAVPPDGIEISYCHSGYIGLLWASSNTVASLSGAGASGDFLFKNNYLLGAGAIAQGMAAASSAVCKPIITDNYFEAFGAAYTFSVVGYGGEISRNTFRSSACEVSGTTYYGALTFLAANNFTGSGNTFDNCTSPILLSSGFQKVEFTDNVYGPTVANTNGDIIYDDGSLLDVQDNSPTGAVVVSPTFAGAVLGAGSIRIRDYNDTVADYRSTVPGGIYYSSSGDLVGRTTQTTAEIFTEYEFLANAVSTYKLAAVVGCKIANAAYYAGTFTAPTLSAQYGTETAVTDTAASNTNQQTLVAIMTPATNGKNISITLSQKTDATGANADVTWSDLKLNTRKYGYTFGQVSKAISEIIPYVYGEVSTPTSNPFITEAVEATVAAYTGIAVDDATQTITITVSHTVNELYDYLQYKNALDAGMEYDEYLSTIDGSVFTSPYNIVVSNCALSGAGKTIDVGSMDFSLSGTGTYDGKWIDAGGTFVPITISGLITGSTVWIYNDDDAVELYKDVVSSTTLLVNFDYTATKNVTIRVRKANYLAYEANNVITSNGMAQIVAQEADTIYTEIGVDGSTVTECSLSGATIRIYVDDPDNLTRGDRIYCWYKYITATTTYIDIQDDNVIALTNSYFKFGGGLKFINQDLVNPLEIIGAKITDTAGSGAAVVDTSNGASMVIVSDAYGLTASQDTTLRKTLSTGVFMALK